MLYVLLLLWLLLLLLIIIIITNYYYYYYFVITTIVSHIGQLEVEPLTRTLAFSRVQALNRWNFEYLERLDSYDTIVSPQWWSQEAFKNWSVALMSERLVFTKVFPIETSLSLQALQGDTWQMLTTSSCFVRQPDHPKMLGLSVSSWSCFFF